MRTGVSSNSDTDTLGCVLVTGGAGFIGSALVRLLIAETESRVVNVDKLTYAATPEAVESVAGDPRYTFEHADIGDGEAMARILGRHRPDAVIHLAAESHVDRSIDGPAPFIETNVVGTFTLLEAALAYWRSLDPARRERFRFLHVSTDEVFGSLTREGRFSPESPYRPNSPYAASKAAADHFARAWRHTYGLPVIVSNCSNNYGPFQFPEKLIPLTIISALKGRPLPVYGAGENVRDWLHVEDHARALLRIMTSGRVGETYAIGGDAERTNIDVVRAICGILDAALPQSPDAPHETLIRFVEDRPGHDLRYAIDAGKVRRELGWAPRETFESGLRRTVHWYLEHRDWWETLLERRYGGERLGLMQPEGAA